VALWQDTSVDSKKL